MERFVNPYNFIPFEDAGPAVKTREQQYRSSEALKSGWMDISLYVKTPLIIPDGAHPVYIDPATGKQVINPKEEEKKTYHKKYSFMKYGSSYVIPGSELRGMLRSVYESVTNSCVRELMSEKPISQRVPAFSAMNKRGLLAFRDGCWVLYKTEKEIVKKFEPHDKEDAKRQKSRIEKWPDDPGTKLEDGYYLQYNLPVAVNPPSDRNPKGQPYTIYKIKPAEITHRWNRGDEEPFRSLRSALKRDGVTGNQRNSNQRCMQALLQKLEKARTDPEVMVPVFYFIVNRGEEKLVYLSGSSIGRIGHRRKWADVLEGHTPCKGPDYCPACLLFGSIKEKGLKGHVRISDAYPVSGEIKGTCHTLEILGEPRPSAFEFYYRKPSENARFWNQDFFSYTSVRKGSPMVVFEDLAHATPRGRKMYWHGEPGKDAEMSAMNSTMEAVKPDAPFTFRIFFDQVTDSQLKDLEWTITLGENAASGHRQHKLGHAKPLGYGSIKLVIDKIHTRCVKSENGIIRYAIRTDEGPAEIQPAAIDLGSIAVRSVLAMTDVNTTRGKKVAYPHYDNDRSNAIFNWFSNNHKNAQRLKVLPEPTAPGIELEGMWFHAGGTQGTRPNPQQDILIRRERTSAGQGLSQGSPDGRGPYTIGQVVSGRVKGHNPSGKFARIDLGNGRAASVFDNGKCAENTIVQIIYNGFDGQYHKWKLKE